MMSKIYVDATIFGILSDMVGPFGFNLSRTIVMENMDKVNESQRSLIDIIMKQMSYFPTPTMPPMHRFVRSSSEQWIWKGDHSLPNKIDFSNGQHSFEVIKMEESWVRTEVMPPLEECGRFKVRDAKHAWELTQKTLVTHKDLTEMMECIYDASQAGEFTLYVDRVDTMSTRQSQLADKLRDLGFAITFDKEKFQISWQ